MDTQLIDDISQTCESLKSELYESLPHWLEAKNPAALFDFEQELQVTLNTLQSRVVRAVIEALHRDTAFVRACKAQALDDLGMRNSGQRERQVRTLSGSHIRVRSPYVALPSTEDSCHEENTRRREGSGLFPVLRRLGIVRGATPRFLAEISRQMTDGPSGAEAEERLASREIMIKDRPMWYHTRDFASIALWQRQEAVSNLDHVEAIEPSPLAGRRVVVGIDGGRLRIRTNKSVHDRDLVKSYSMDDCEPKLFVIYTIDAKGNKDNEHDFVYDGTLQSTQMLFSLLKRQLKHLGVEQAELLVIIGDGASWIWTGAKDLRTYLNMEKVPVFEIVDFAHSVGKMMVPARLGIRDPLQRKIWFKRMRRLVKAGKIDEVIEALSKLDLTSDEDGEVAKAIGYFRRHRARMRYHSFRQEGLPIGSGVIESGVKRIVNLRLRGTTTFWSPERAEQLLYLRCIVKSGQWNMFVKSVLSYWSDDMSTSLAKVYDVNKEIRRQFLESHSAISSDKSRSSVIEWAKQILDSANILVLDTETTGLLDDDEIVQLAIIDLQGQIVLQLSFRPTIPICDEASMVHGITNTDLENCPTFAEMHTIISKILSNKDIVAYNADFDHRLLAQTCKRYGLPTFENITWHCAMEKYACFWGDRRGKTGFRRFNLSTACQQQDITIGETHQAVRDCLLTLELVKAIAFTTDEE